MHGSPFSVPPLQGLHHDFSSRLLCQSLFQNGKPVLKQTVSSAIHSLFFISDHSTTRPEWCDMCQLWISGRYDATTVLQLTHNYYSTINLQLLLLRRRVCSCHRACIILSAVLPTPSQVVIMLHGMMWW